MSRIYFPISIKEIIRHEIYNKKFVFKPRRQRGDQGDRPFTSIYLFINVIESLLYPSHCVRYVNCKNENGIVP